MRTLHGVDIFMAGKWKNTVFDVKDLDAIVEAFNSHATGTIRPPLKLGHDETQRWWGQKDGAPALGWVEKLYRAGAKLVADFAGIPDVVYDLIKAGKYTGKSAEIYLNYEDEAGKVWPRALRAVSLLGADIPAVSTLDDLRAVLMSDAKYTEQNPSGAKATWEEYTVENNDAGRRNQMDWEKEAKEYKEKLDKLTEGNAQVVVKLTAETARADKAEARAVKAEAELADRDEKFAVAQFTAKLESLIKDGKVLPAEKEGIIRTFSMLPAGVRKFGEKDINAREDMQKTLEARSVIVKFAASAAGGENRDSEVAAAKVDRLAKEYMRKENKNYEQAIQFVRETHPEEWKEYVMGGTKNE